MNQPNNPNQDETRTQVPPKDDEHQAEKAVEDHPSPPREEKNPDAFESEGLAKEVFGENEPQPADRDRRRKQDEGGQDVN